MSPSGEAHSENIDFGLAIGVSGTSTAAMTAATKTHATGGTFAYRAPETFNGIYTKASEVYSYAMVLYELLTAERPWYRDPEGRPYMDANVLNLVVNKAKRPELPGSLYPCRVLAHSLHHAPLLDSSPRNAQRRDSHRSAQAKLTRAPSSEEEDRLGAG